MDTKATAFLGGNVGAATFLLSRVPATGWERRLYITAIILFAISTVVAGGVIFTRNPGNGSSVISWGGIAAQPDLRSYQRDFNRTIERSQLDDHYCAQNYNAARVLRRKFRWLRCSVILFVLAVFCGFAVYVQSR